MRVLVGTSGYAYKEWKGPFYPADLPDERMLEYYGRHLRAVEINNTFYRMPSSQVVEHWAESVPQGFAFSIKASRRITHMGRLKNVADSVSYLFDKTALLGDKLGCVLFQLPPFLEQDLPRLNGFLDLLPDGPRVALEFRHGSWFDEPVYEALRARNVALCLGDEALKHGSPVPFVPTADWGYLRLRELEYDVATLRRWARRVADQAWDRAFVFFKHEDAGAGPKLAARFIELLDS